MEYSLIVLELNDVVKRRESSKPNLYVAITVMSLAKRFGQLNSGKGPLWLSGNLQLLRRDLSRENFTLDHDCAKSYKAQAISAFCREGYTVNRNTDIWTVYVIGLDPSATRNPGEGYVYVGETKRTPEERLEQHLSRAKNAKTRLYSSVVANHGIGLRMDLAPSKKYFDSQSAKKAEADWVEHLRSLGYTVKGGH